MTATGGSIEAVTINDRNFPVAADAESQRKKGGFENEVAPNGDGFTARKIKTKVAWLLDGLQLEVDDLRGDHEFLQGIADLNDFVDITITYASGVTYQGQGTITGELQVSSQNALAAVTLSGPGVLTPQ